MTENLNSKIAKPWAVYGYGLGQTGLARVVSLSEDKKQDIYNILKDKIILQNVGICLMSKHLKLLLKRPNTFLKINVLFGKQDYL